MLAPHLQVVQTLLVHMHPAHAPEAQGMASDASLAATPQQLLTILQHWHHTPTLSPADMAEAADKLGPQAAVLREQVLAFVRDASVVDAPHRSQALGRILGIIRVVKTTLAGLQSLLPSDSHVATTLVAALGAADHLLVLQQVHKWASQLAALHPALEATQAQLQACNERGAAFAITRLLTSPAVGSADTLGHALAAAVERVRCGGEGEQRALVQDCGRMMMGVCTWACRMSLPVEVALAAAGPPLSHEQLWQLQELFNVSEAERDLAQALGRIDRTSLTARQALQEVEGVARGEAWQRLRRSVVMRQLGELRDLIELLAHLPHPSPPTAMDVDLEDDLPLQCHPHQHPNHHQQHLQQQDSMPHDHHLQHQQQEHHHLHHQAGTLCHPALTQALQGAPLPSQLQKAAKVLVGVAALGDKVAFSAHLDTVRVAPPSVAELASRCSGVSGCHMELLLDLSGDQAHGQHPPMAVLVVIQGCQDPDTSSSSSGDDEDVRGRLGLELVMLVPSKWDASGQLKTLMQETVRAYQECCAQQQIPSVSTTLSLDKVAKKALGAEDGCAHAACLLKALEEQGLGMLRDSARTNFLGRTTCKLSSEQEGAFALSAVALWNEVGTIMAATKQDADASLVGRGCRRAMLHAALSVVVITMPCCSSVLWRQPFLVETLRLLLTLIVCNRLFCCFAATGLPANPGA